MKQFAPTILAISASLLLQSAVAHAQGTCFDGDPSHVLSSVNGDFELSYDPQDPAGNVIFISNLNDGPSSIVAARINGVTGQAMPGTLTTVATNFTGRTQNNGPEFILATTGQLGLLFQGAGGVTGIFRGSQPGTAWNAFIYDYSGKKTTLNPPALPNTTPGSINGNPPVPPQAGHTYPQYMGSCTGLCYAATGSGQATDVYAVMASQGYTVSTATQAPQDNYIFVAACDAFGACGVYETSIDGAGGLGTVTKVASTPQAPTNMSAFRHPVTGTTVISTNKAQNYINVWEQKTLNGGFNLLSTVTAPGNTHHRAMSDITTQVVINYLVRAGANIGSYTIPVTASGSTLVVGGSTLASTAASGSELDWYPAANKFGILYRTSKTTYQHCWVTP